MTAVFGFIWGMAVFVTVIMANQNYAAITAFVDTQENGILYVLAGAGFIGLSLLIVAVMLLSGLLQLFAGRRMPGRWLTLLGFGLGAAGAGVATPMMGL